MKKKKEEIEILDLDNKNKKVKKTKLNKKIIIIIVSILLILGIIFGIIIIDRNNKIKVLEKEIIKINNIDVLESELDTKIYSKKDFGKVESAIKDYYKEFFEYKYIFESNRAESLYNYLSPEYLKSNKKDLKKIKNDFITKNSEVDESIDNIIKMLDKDYMLKYIDKYDVSDYYKDLYLKYMVSEKDKEIIKDYNEIKDSNKERFNYLIELIDLLIKYKNSWYVEENNIIIENKTCLSKYNDLHDLIYGIKKEV